MSNRTDARSHLLDAAARLVAMLDLIRDAGSQESDPCRMRIGSLPGALLPLALGREALLFADRNDLATAFAYEDIDRAALDLLHEQPPRSGSRVGGTFLGGPNGAFLTHATGAGWAMRTQKKVGVALALFSSSLVESGEFHNALNFAGVTRARVLYFAAHSGPPGEIQRIGVEYGIAAERVVFDSAEMDPIEEMVARATAQEGPLLVEADVRRVEPWELTSRMLGIADDVWRERVLAFQQAFREMRATWTPRARRPVDHVFAAWPPNSEGIS